MSNIMECDGMENNDEEIIEYFMKEPSMGETAEDPDEDVVEYSMKAESVCLSHDGALEKVGRAISDPGSREVASQSDVCPPPPPAFEHHMEKSPARRSSTQNSMRLSKLKPGFMRYLKKYRNKVEELSNRSISVDRLLHFYHEVFIKTFNMDSTALTQDVVQDIIIPMTEEDALSWVDYLEQHTEYVENTPQFLPSREKSRPFITHAADDAAGNGLPRTPTTHVVHAWKMRFVDLLSAVLWDASGQKTRKLGESYQEACRIYKSVLDKPYWICCFCINQHFSICHEPHFKCRCGARKFDDTMPECEFDKFAAVAQTLHKRGGGMVLALEKDLQCLSRAWCVDEVHYALMTGMAIKPSFSTLPSFSNLREFVCEVRQCQARPVDQERILRRIEGGTGIPAFNDRVTKFLQKEAKILIDSAKSRSRSISVTRRRRAA